MGGRTLSRLSRRGFLGAAAAAVARPSFAAGAGPGIVVPHPTDVRVEEVRHRYEEFRYRTPMKFGGREVDRVTLLHVDCVVHTRGGRTVKGFGSMPLGNVWAYPSRQLPFEETLGAMKALADRIATITGGCREWGHAVDLATTLEPEWLKAAAELSVGRAEPIPKLATLVVASPFDAALHDAYGKAHGRSVLPGVRARVPAAGPRPVPRRRVRGRPARPARARRPAPARASLPCGRRLRPADRRRAHGPRRRRPARDARRVGAARRPHALQDQAERRRRGLGRRARARGRARRRRRSSASEASPAGSTRSTSTSAARTSATCSSCCGRSARSSARGVRPHPATSSSRRAATSRPTART